MEQATDVRVFQLGNTLSFVAVVVVNSLANILPLNNVSTGELSDSYPNYFVPAGYVFSIWLVIYLLLLGFTVRQLRRGGDDAETLRKIGWLFVVSNVFNFVWIFIWHWRLVALSLLAMFGLLASLIMIYLRLDIGRAQVSREVRIYYHLPFSVYLGWITVAPIANIVAFLVSSGWESYGTAAAYWKKRSRDRRLSMPFAEYIADAAAPRYEESGLAASMRRLIRKCIDRLQERQREIVLLRYYRNLNSSGIGRRMGM